MHKISHQWIFHICHLRMNKIVSFVTNATFFIENLTVIKEQKWLDPHIVVIHCLSTVISDVAVLLSWLSLDCESVHITI